MDLTLRHKTWDWQEENGVGMAANFDTSQCIWDEVTRDVEDLFYMFDETTPVKACTGLTYEMMGNAIVGETSKDIGDFSSLQVKRRRMLQFDSHAADPSLRCDKLSSAFLKSAGYETNDTSKEVCSELSSWISAETADDFPDGWLSQCLNDPDINFSPDDINNIEDNDVHIDVSEYWDQPNCENMSIQPQVVRTPQKIVFKGRKSYIRTPSKLATSIAYPFGFIKPCGVRGDVTLKDINQRIRTPPPPKTKNIAENTSPAYPTSAFSGKPVVGKTKIRTEGGKGSITIMRTKG
ncbi:hypothetical protein MLD38_025162 [Melastoma candidum]|uniref:Uncharacterized protein n=1 Tax=Melastoma candidum TaxID=119954 RepID=A0ACB9NVH5_9MYRT|nr:hypothetical protein MLD38_025162 [Melastoma candidum]